jgi:CBS domain-containing protein
MKVADCMTRDVRVVTPEQTIQDAARQMLDADTGALVVGTAEEPRGIVTDRDIAVRAVAQGRGPDTPVGEVMSGDVVTVREDQDLDDVAVLMSDRQVRRVAVLSDDGRLSGMISVGDLAKSNDSDTAEAAMTGIAQDGGEHQQRVESAS